MNDWALRRPNVDDFAVLSLGKSSADDRHVVDS